MVCFTLSSKRILPLLIHLLYMYSQCAGSKFVEQFGCRDPRTRSYPLRSHLMVVPLSRFSAVSIRIELTLNETSGKLIKMKSFAHENHENSFIFCFHFLFRMLLIVLLSVSKRGALENRSELPNRCSKEDKKNIDFCVLSLVFRKN